MILRAWISRHYYYAIQTEPIARALFLLQRKPESILNAIRV